MKTIIALMVSGALLFSVPLAMARGASERANINRIWQKEQSYQNSLDRKLDKIQREATQGRALPHELVCRYKPSRL